jgi:hypothetical protein
MDAPFRGGDAVKLYAPATSTRRGLIAHLGRKYGRQKLLLYRIHSFYAQQTAL